MTGHTASVAQLRGARCLADCHFGGPLKAHHDQLLRVDRDPDQAFELLELALTWDELDYDAEHLIEPAAWDHFLESHRWRDRARAVRVFSLADSIMMRASSPTYLESPGLSVFSALTGQPAVTLRSPLVARP